MKRSFKNISISALLISMLVNANLTYGYYIILNDEDPSKSAFTTVEQPASDQNKPSISEKKGDVLPPIMPETNKLAQTDSIDTSQVPKTKKTINTRKKHIVHCPSIVTCGNGETRPVNYTIAFNKNKMDINEVGKKRLDALIPRMRYTKVCIIGRPDFVLYSNGNATKLSVSRAYNIRKYLLSKGIETQQVTVSAKNDPYTEDDGTTFSSDIIIIEKKEAIEKRKVNLKNVDASLFIKNISNVSTNILKNENAKIALIDSDNDTINFIDHSIKDGSIKEPVASHIKELIKFNEIRILKYLSYNRSM